MQLGIGPPPQSQPSRRCFDCLYWAVQTTEGSMAVEVELGAKSVVAGTEVVTGSVLGEGIPGKA